MQIFKENQIKLYSILVAPLLVYEGGIFSKENGFVLDQLTAETKPVLNSPSSPILNQVRLDYIRSTPI